MTFTKPIIRPAELAEVLHVSLPTLWSWRKKGILPEPIVLGPRFIGWRAEVLNDWLESR
ncbi:helix-turn-helix domain-containing protein [Rheinheimera texasensis]|uniref:helix-turn-helix transcriptional regulator n=1 Tax=Rheinheimera texasensis TaxID=306205 RepID=UPI0012FF1AC5